MYFLQMSVHVKKNSFFLILTPVFLSSAPYSSLLLCFGYISYGFGGKGRGIRRFLCKRELESNEAVRRI